MAPVGSLNQATAYESPAHSSTGTWSEPWLLPLLGSLRFHVLFHSPMGVLFILPSRYYFAISHPGVFSLARWSLLIHTGFHMPHATRVRALSLACPWIQQQFEKLQGESVKLPTQYPQSSPKQHLYGIGYDPTSDDYKIIRIDWNKNVPDEILALKSGSWRKIGEYAGGINGVHWTSPMKLCLAFVEGAFHWLGREKDCVVSFNISNEIYGEIPLPVTPYSNRIEEKRVSAVGRRLYYHHDDEINFNLWVMKDYGMKESWTKLFSIQSHGEGIMAPIYRFSNDEVLLSCYGLKGSIYKTSNGSSNRTWPLHLNDISDLKRTIDGFVYTEIEKREIAMDLLQQPNEDGSNNAAKLVEKREIAVVQATRSIENNRYGICKEPPPLPPPPYPQPPPPYPQPNHRHPTASTSNTNMPPNHPKPPPYYNQNIPNSYYWLLPPQPQGFYGPPYPQQFQAPPKGNNGDLA
ncbi:hypothetical protein BC332_32776 [Capsicum chinense]|nr:hypothetical protein BC332_32776 [Capsicum chinense]